MADRKVSANTAYTTPVDGDYLIVLNTSDTTDGPAGTEKKTLWSNIKATLKTYLDTLYVALSTVDGWTIGTGTWSYSSADAPTFVISINADVTALIGVGDRIKLTQTTAKYFIVTAVGAFSAGATLITVYGGTDYTLANAAITSPFYSHAKSPFGFPTSPAKWTVGGTADSTTRTQNTPTQNVWYNLNAAHTISLPIGVWRVRYRVMIDVTVASATTASVYGTLSTANNSESDNTNTAFAINVGATAALEVAGLITLNRLFTIAAKTPYYFNVKTSVAGMGSISALNSLVPLILEAECAYL